MKTLANLFLVAIMGMVVVNFVACTTDDDDFGTGIFTYQEKNDTIVKRDTVTNTVRDTTTVVVRDTVEVTPTTPSDTTSNTPTTPSIDWSIQMEKSFGYVKATNLWPSTITVHRTDGQTETFGCYLPMETKIEAPAEITVSADAPASSFTALGNVKIDSTAWAKNESDGYFYRTITRTQVIVMNNYEAKIISTHKECYMIKEGKVIYFKHGQEATPTRWNDTPTSGEDIQRNGKTYSVENALICMKHVLHASKTEYPQATTRVLREKVVEQQQEEEPTTPVVNPTMPTPDLKVSSFGLVNNITFSPEFNGNNVTWHKVCLTRNTINGKEYFSIWVDGSFVRTVELNSREANNKYNSAYLAEGVWVPAILKYSTANDGGWDYTFVLNNSAKLKTIDQSMALTSGLSNFKKDNNAAQTPSVYTTTSVKEYGTKKLVTVTGYDKDMKPVINFTIGECL